jgi:hypothetical protein
MKRTILIIISLFLFVGCTSTKSFSEEELKMIEDAKKTQDNENKFCFQTKITTYKDKKIIMGSILSHCLSNNQFLNINIKEENNQNIIETSVTNN